MTGRITEPGNLFLICIVCLCVCLVYHGETLIKVPVYSSAEIRSGSTEKQVYANEMNQLRQLEEEKLKKHDRSKDDDWTPPCFPDEATTASPNQENKNLLAISALLKKIQENDDVNDDTTVENE